MPLPFRNTPIDRPNPLSQSSGFISSPDGRSQTMSGSGAPTSRRTGLPSKNRRRRKVGWSRRSADTRRGELDQGVVGIRSQCVQVSSESWQ